MNQGDVFTGELEEFQRFKNHHSFVFPLATKRSNFSYKGTIEYYSRILFGTIHFIAN
jgi:hypothetical protein